MKVLTQAEAREISNMNAVYDEVLRIALQQVGEFKLRDISRPVVDKMVPQDVRQNYRIGGPGETNPPSINGWFTWDVREKLRRDTRFNELGNGLFSVKGSVDDDDEADDTDEMERIDETLGVVKQGWVYAYTFPDLMRDGDYKIKIGMTTGDYTQRITDQTKGEMAFDTATILQTWPTGTPKRLEDAVHAVLKQRGKHCTAGRGTEWFVTSITEIRSIIEFVGDGSSAGGTLAACTT